MLIIKSETKNWKKENVRRNGETITRFSQNGVALDFVKELMNELPFTQKAATQKIPGNHRVVFSHFDFDPIIIPSNNTNTALTLFDTRIPEGYDRIINVQCSDNTFVLEYSVKDDILTFLTSTLTEKGAGYINVYLGNEDINTTPIMVSVILRPDMEGRDIDIKVTQKENDSLVMKYRRVDKLTFQPYRPYNLTSKVYVKQGLSQEANERFGKGRNASTVHIYRDVKHLKHILKTNSEKHYKVGTLYTLDGEFDEEKSVLDQYLSMYHVYKKETGRVSRHRKGVESDG